MQVLLSPSTLIVKTEFLVTTIFSLTILESRIMQYHLVFSTDNNYLPYLFVLLQSIIDHLEVRDNNKDDEIIFHVISDQSIDLQDSQTKSDLFLKRNHTAGVTCRFEWHILDSSEFSCFDKMTKNGLQSFGTYYRLVIDQVLSTHINTVAYLDIDMLVLSDIRDLFLNHQLKTEIIGAVVDPGISNTNPSLTEDAFTYLSYKDNPSKQIKIPRDKYFNAGLLLINLYEWRTQHIGEECLKLASQMNLQFHDQDLLNYVCQGKVKLLDLSWNFQNPMFYVLYNPETKKYDIRNIFQQDRHWLCETPSAHDFEKQLQNPRIVHFTDHKPWQPAYLGSSLFYGPTVPVLPRLQYYCDEWIKTSHKVVEFPSIVHVLNSDAVDFNFLTINQINKKRRKDRKILLYLIAVSLLLNCITLIHSLLF